METMSINHAIKVLLIFNSFIAAVLPVHVKESYPDDKDDDCKSHWENLAIQLKDVKKENADLKSELSAIKDDMKHILATLETITDIQSAKYENNKQRRLLEGTAILPTVAFSAYLSKNVNLGNTQTVEYDVVITNTGNHYNPSHGIFTAPFSGIYLFSASICTFPDESVHLTMVKNGQIVANLYSHNNGWDLASQTIVLQLSNGDEVWVKHEPTYDQSGHTTLFNVYNTFSGVLLNRTE